MKRVRSLTILFACLAASCAGDSTATFAPASVPDARGRDLFPLDPGTTWVYEGVLDGRVLREEVHVEADSRSILGVDCAALVETMFLDGELAEWTTEWFATDDQGNVWKFGEDSLLFDGETVAAGDSWVAGEGDAHAWIAMPARPREGLSFLGYRPGGPDLFAVASTDAIAEVPAGVFAACVELVENPGDVEDQDIILYAPGVGRVAEISTNGHNELVEVRRR